MARSMSEEARYRAFETPSRARSRPAADYAMAEPVADSLLGKRVRLVQPLGWFGDVPLGALGTVVHVRAPDDYTVMLDFRGGRPVEVRLHGGDAQPSASEQMGS